MKYKVLNQQSFTFGDYTIVPIRLKDRYKIMKWRNEQMYHLRQSKLLTKADQDKYFEEVVSKLFQQDEPDQILFSYLNEEKCIGYGGLVNINWIDRNAELSFIMDTDLETEMFELHWSNFLKLIEKVAFDELDIHKIFTYAFDLRPLLYLILENNGFYQDAVLNEHCIINGNYLDVIIHAKTNVYLRKASQTDLKITYKWATDSKVREFSFNQSFIEFETHKEWFISKLNSSNCLYYILMRNTKPIGSIRFDLEGNEAVISYLLDPKYHGQGLGKKLLQQGIQNLIQDSKEIKKIVGEVMSNNTPSIKLFKKLGFEKSSDSGSKLIFSLVIE